jgi:hypothetical protein
MQLRYFNQLIMHYLEELEIECIHSTSHERLRGLVSFYGRDRVYYAIDKAFGR